MLAQDVPILPVEFVSEHRSEPSVLLDAPYVAIAFYTRAVADRAQRLRTSLDTFGIAYSLFEIPEIHRSVSPMGTANLAYSKPNLVLAALADLGRPVLYLDADTVVRQRPTLIEDLVKNDVEFAAYNWLAEDVTETYWPCHFVNEQNNLVAGFTRFYTHAGHEDKYSTKQLSTSGATQFYSCSRNAKRLLAEWREVIGYNADVDDDPCLNASFTMLVRDGEPLKYYFLPKIYVRYPFFIYDAPVIDHPGWPVLRHQQMDAARHPRSQRSPMRSREMGQKPPKLPRNCIISLQTREIFAARNNMYVRIGRVVGGLFISGEPVRYVVRRPALNILSIEAEHR